MKTIVLAILGSLFVNCLSQEIRAVLSGIDPYRFQQAWNDNQLGLVLLRLDQESYIGVDEQKMLSLVEQGRGIQIGLEAGNPSFDSEGGLIFEKDKENGHVVFSRQQFYLPYLSTEPKFVQNLPLVVPPPQPIVPRNESVNAPYKICIDPGHGGSDPGAIGQGYEEAAINLDVSIRFRDLLLKDNGRWTVLMTRTTDVDVSLSGRTTMANNWPADRFLSIHCNAFSSSSAQGTETFSYQEGSTSAKLRDLVQSEMIKAWGLVNRGSKTADFYVLKNTNMPATLSELGFITSPVDIQKLKDPNARQQIAAAHMYALRRHYGFSTEDLEDQLF